MRQGLLARIAWYSMARRSPRPSSASVVWAVRRDWPDGSHELVRARMSEEAARGQLVGERAFWRPGPVRPSLSVVQLSAHEFRLHGRHRRFCSAPDCASAAIAATVAG